MGDNCKYQLQHITARGSGRHIKVAGAGVYDGGVGYSVEGFGRRRGGTAARISIRNKVLKFIVTCYAGGTAASLHEIVPALVAGGAGARGILAGCSVDVDGFLVAASGTGIFRVNTLAMGGSEAADDPFVFERRTDL